MMNVEAPTREELRKRPAKADETLPAPRDGAGNAVVGEQAKQGLRDQSRFLLQLLESLTHPLCVIDAHDYTIKLANSAFGLEGLADHSKCYGSIHQQDRPCEGPDRLCPLPEVRRTRGPVAMEHVYRDRNGRKRIVEVHGFPILDRSGRVVQMIEYSLDITERKLAEDALRLSEECFRTLSEASPVGVFATSADGEPAYWNGRMCTIVGVPFEVARRQGWMPCVHPEDRERVSAEWSECLRKKVGFRSEHRFVGPQGRVTWAIMHATPVTESIGGQVTSYVGTVTDITARKQVEDRLQESKEAEQAFSRRLIELLNVTTRLSKMDSSQEIIRRAIELGRSALGFDRLSVWLIEDEPGFAVGSFGTDESGNTRDEHGQRVALDETDRKLLARQIPYWREEDVPLQDGRGRVVGRGTRACAAIGDDRNPIGIMVLDNLLRGRPLTRSDCELLSLLAAVAGQLLLGVRARDALRASEERFRHVLASVNDGVWASGPEGQPYIYLSPAIERIYGRPVGYFQMNPQAWLESVHPDDRPSVMNHTHTLHEEGTLEAEYRIIRPNGEVRWVHDRKAAVRDEQGNVTELGGIVTDITERRDAQGKARQWQAQLAHALRFHTMGEMAAGIAHELNQPLCAIANYAEACMMATRGRGNAGDKKLLHHLEEIAGQAGRAGDIIRRFRSFVRRQEPRRSSVNMNNAIQEVVQLVESEARLSSIQIKLRLARDVPTVQADPIQVQQVVLNLVRNAFEAMNDTENGIRELTIQTSAAADGAVEVMVSDTGQGMSDENMARLFEPFHSTKPDGLGLGLTISRSIISAHGGRLTGVRNPDGGGMTFRFILPQHEGGPSHGIRE